MGAKKKPPMENEILNAVVGICEGREHSGEYKGDGFHLAQEITKAVTMALLPPTSRKVFDSLTNQPTKVDEIAAKCGVASNNVSTFLLRMRRQTTLVSSNRQGRFHLWYKINTNYIQSIEL